MDFSEAAGKRRTVRDFSRRGVSEAVIEKAVGLAFKAPSYNHLRQWDFILVRDGETKLRLTRTEDMADAVTPEIASAFKNHDETAKAMYLEAIPKQRMMILGAPVVLAVVFRPKTPVSEAERSTTSTASPRSGAASRISSSPSRRTTCSARPSSREYPRSEGCAGNSCGSRGGCPDPHRVQGDGYREMPQKEIDIHSRIHRERW
jgi:hypothetical protein